jgi:hypothetical protein
VTTSEYPLLYVFAIVSSTVPSIFACQMLWNELNDCIEEGILGHLVFSNLDSVMIDIAIVFKLLVLPGTPKALRL